jgi:TDG/mug DNA glycosylase family protein
MSTDDPAGDGRVGHQATVSWMGSSESTLADLWPPHPRAVIVGLNPTPRSVAAGHYYQGRFGQRQLGRYAGLFKRPAEGSHIDDEALAAGIGFTDIVKRPSRGERDVSAAEIAHAG